jgi:hypothetical protein
MEIADDSAAYIATLKTLPDSSGFRGVYGGFCGIAGLAGTASLFIRHFDMNKVLESEHKLQEHR